jgi:hypothetical protein
VRSTTYALSVVAVGGSLFATWVSLRVATNVTHAWYEWVVLGLAVSFWAVAVLLIALVPLSRPRLRLRQATLGERKMKPGRWAKFAYVEVLNEPRLGSNEARDVHGQVTFLDGETGEAKYVIERAQWEHLEPSLEAVLTPEITIPASRGARRLNVAFKNDQEADAHPYGDEHVFGAAPCCLPAGGYRVLVEVFGSNVRRAEAEFLLSHSGVDGRLEFQKKQ